ncbi:MAG: response regulator, partial [Tepidiformaceae bacterium]
MLKKALRILLAEDERTISRLIRQVLTTAGHEVVGVQTAAEAIEQLGSGAFDLILLDLNLADGDGFRVVEAVRRIAGDGATPTPVLLMTGEHHFD